LAARIFGDDFWEDGISRLKRDLIEALQVRMRKTMNIKDTAPNYVIEPAAHPAIPIAGSDQLFPVHHQPGWRKDLAAGSGRRADGPS
jgi:hypothetical protein